ncbi:MAG: 5-guanidino-2-oxopentanoate decarboxylase [Rhodobacteraceae bacterium]|nr:5-guanidino-2-oxopentanoate decarboxylase [Paracoccaceae bacterium]
MTTVGEALVRALKDRGVKVVFGIPGVHTVELYRGLAGSGIRHVTPRHEQGAGFMADGYARVSGRPGVAFVITGPGLTNMLTPMAQARADSVPMLVVSGVNRRDTLGRGMGHLHELPDQRGMTALVALGSERIEGPEGLASALGRAFAGLASGRPGPRHIEVPTDVMPMQADDIPAPAAPAAPALPLDALRRAAQVLGTAQRPLILAGGGARFAGEALRAVAERLGAPVVQTANARGLMHGHALTVPASPSLEPVRDLMRGADMVLAVGTEFGPTEYDMYVVGGVPRPAFLIRIEVDAAQMARHPAEIALEGHAEAILPGLAAMLQDRQRSDGLARAARAREAARAALEPAMRRQLAVLEAIRDAVPGAILVGDSTQPVYAGNLYYDHDRPGGWFNAATGYGALGYGLPAAIGAAIAAPEAPVICLAGDGGAQFTLPELMTAVQERVPLTFVIWNNRAYREIAEAMVAAGAEPIGTDPVPPDFALIARACGVPHVCVAADPAAVAAALGANPPKDGPVMIEIDVRD